MSIGLAFRSPRQKTSLTDGWKLSEQGPESQSASAGCSGGVSAVIGSSDLNGHTFHPSAVNGYPSYRSLPSGAKPASVLMACLTQLWVIQIHQAKLLIICGGCRAAERQLIRLSLFHVSRGSIEGQKKPGHHTRLMRRGPCLSASDQYARGLFEHSPSDDAGDAVRRCQLN